MLRQLLAWQSDLSGAAEQLLADCIYVLTPQAAIVELPSGATPVDFAYTVHTSLGHRCRGARVDGAMVTLNTPPRSGQTVEIVATKEGGRRATGSTPSSASWSATAPEQGARLVQCAGGSEDDAARGREAIERLLQREGRTALRHEEPRQRARLRNAAGAVRVGRQGRDLRCARSSSSRRRPKPCRK